MGDKEVRRAQSSGLWPGVRRTFFRGLVGMLLWVAGGVRDVDVGLRFGRGPRAGGAMSPAERLGRAMDPAPVTGET